MSAHRALSGRRVVVTRPEPRGGPLATAIADAGGEPVLLPLLRVAAVAFEVPSAANLSSYDHLVFTSATGVAMFVDALSAEARNVFVKHPGVAVVGPATARAVVERGGRAAVVAPEHVAESLADTIGSVRGGRLLWPRAEVARRALATRLRARGATVAELVVYRTVAEVPTNAVDTVRDADAVTFTSPSGVAAWVRSLGTPRTRVVCIGPITAAAAHAQGINVDAVGHPFTIPGLVHALCRLFESPNARGA